MKSEKFLRSLSYFYTATPTPLFNGLKIYSPISLNIFRYPLLADENPLKILTLVPILVYGMFASIILFDQLLEAISLSLSLSLSVSPTPSPLLSLSVSVPLSHKSFTFEFLVCKIWASALGSCTNARFWTKPDYKRAEIRSPNTRTLICLRTMLCDLSLFCTSSNLSKFHGI